MTMPFDIYPATSEDETLGEEKAKERGAPTPLEEKVTFLFPQTPISIRLSPFPDHREYLKML